MSDREDKKDVLEVGDVEVTKVGLKGEKSESSGQKEEIEKEMEKKPKKKQIPKCRHLNPWFQIFFPLKWMFEHITIDILKGFRKPLELDDLPEIEPAMQTRNVEKKFDCVWSKIKKGSKVRLFLSLLYCIAWNGGISFFLNFCASIVMSTIPLFIRQVLLNFSPLLTPSVRADIAFSRSILPPELAPPSDALTSLGYRENDYMVWVWLCCLVLAKLVHLLLSLNAIQIGAKTSVQLIGVLNIKLFKKALKLSNKSLSGRYNLGKLMSLMSVDCMNIGWVVEMFSFVFNFGVLLVPSIIFLFLILGFNALFGIIVGCISIPISIIFFIVVIYISRNLFKRKDRRVKMVNEIIQGIAIIKLFCWEQPNLKKILANRGKEVKLNRIKIILRSLAFSALYLTPTLMGLTSFSSYFLTSNKIDPVVIFTSLAYFEAIRVPVLWIPMAIVYVVEAGISLFRLQDFYEAEEMDEQIKLNLETSKTIIEIKKGSFIWEKDQEYEKKQEKLNKLLGKLKKVSTGKKSLDDLEAEELKEKKNDLKNKKEKKNVHDNKEEENDMEIIEEDNNKKIEVIEGKVKKKKKNEKKKKEVGKLENINLTIKQGELIVIVGKIGSGKSSLLLSILREMKRVEGDLKIGGSIAYCNQTPYNINCSLEENIMFGEPRNENKLDEIINVCALEADLRILKHGRKTDIGEKGVNLSGGQKARISLARAAYSNKDIYLLDDPLSAVDAGVSKHLFNKCITGYLNDKTILLVTHQLQYVSNVHVNRIIMVDHGKIIEIGTYEELMKNEKGEFSKLMKKFTVEGTKKKEIEVDMKENSKIKKLTEKNEKKIEPKKKKIQEEEEGNDKKKKKKNKVVDKIMQAEERFKGSINLRSIYIYAKSMGIWYFLSALSIYIIFQLAISSNQIFLTQWSSGNLSPIYDKTYNTSYVTNSSIINGTIISNSYFMNESLCEINSSCLYKEIDIIWNVNEKEYSNGNVIYSGIPDGYLILIYLSLGIVLAIVQFLREIIFQNLAINAANYFHDAALTRVIFAPQSFYDTTPVGRIISRLSNDVFTLDQELPLWLQIFLDTVFNSIGILTIISVVTSGIMVPFLLIILPIYFGLYIIYRKAGMDLKRLFSLTMSPIFTHVTQCMSGVSTIRAYNKEDMFVDQYFEKLSDFGRACYLWRIAFLWVQLRTDILGLFILILSGSISIILLYYYPLISIAGAALIISISLDVANHMDAAIRCCAGIESQFTCVERLHFYTTEIPNEGKKGEKNYKEILKANYNYKGLLKSGNITFKNYSMRYRKELPLVLKDITLKIFSNERIGIVGRTGCGKSSLVLGLFRVMEAASGKIYIDGKNIAKIELDALRSNLAIIPQDPKLFDGTLRSNLDPFGKYSDVKIMNALEKSNLKDVIEKREKGIDSIVKEGGSNFSTGERQLICLARAMLRNAKILMLDECTSNVDSQTDVKIQKTIRDNLKDCTILTIAHRIKTIIDYDRILILQEGKVIEFDTPRNLLSLKKYKLFKEFVKNTGEENEKYLKSIALKEKYTRKMSENELLKTMVKDVNQFNNSKDEINLLMQQIQETLNS